MPKLKTKSAAKKRFKKLPGGKVKRAKAFRRHLLTKKTTKCKRQLRSGSYVCESDMGHVLRMLPN